MRARGFTVTPLTDKDENGEKFLVKEIDPFTIVGIFNRGIKIEQRHAILAQVKKFFNLQSPLPDDFDGIPILFNLKSWFIAFQKAREAEDVGKLWRVFQLAVQDSPLTNKEFPRAFDDAVNVRNTNVNLTMGLFWIRPDIFLSLDNINRNHLGLILPASGLSAEYYLETLQLVKEQGKSFPEVSIEAWQAANKKTEEKKGLPIPISDKQSGINYWLVGAYWDDRDPSDQTARFLEEGIWENGYDNRYGDDVNSMKVGDKIAIKAAATQRKGLPFDARSHTVSLNIIKAVGTIVANRNDSKIVEVEWDPEFKEKNWYFYTNRSTVWHIKPVGKKVWTEAADQLINFVWYSQRQDYNWFIQKWWGSNGDLENATPFSFEDILAGGAFLEESEIRQIIKTLSEKKAMIIQGAPGVGKTFLARNLAYALMEEVAPERLEMVQFHQSYSYDDFVRGYRPLPGKAGTFGLQNGIFFDFCKNAANDPDRKFVFIIDEINRGNLSQIFGELLMLIEHNKRGPLFSVPLVYRNAQDEPRFYVPSNVYLLGLMNLADRSLAMVDYALRRRFAFITLKPRYESEIYHQWLLDRSMSPDLVDLIIQRLSLLNKTIREDPLLGENYQIGHSFFCPKGDDFTGLNKDWYQEIVHTEIVPLLKEYWFDNQKKADEAERWLLS